MESAVHQRISVAMARAPSQVGGEDRCAQTPWGNTVKQRYCPLCLATTSPFLELLAEYFEVPLLELETKSVSDPVGSVEVPPEKWTGVMRLAGRR
jgi:hypothetical protein